MGKEQAINMSNIQIDGAYTQYDSFSDSPEDFRAVRALYLKQFGKEAPASMPYETVWEALAVGHPDPDSVIDDDPDA